MKLFFLAVVLIVGGLAISKPGSPVSLQEQRWNEATIKVEKQSEVRWIVRKIERNKDRYQSLEKTTTVPWFVIAALHNMECDLRFDRHLYNGDPLTGRTVNEPKGQPVIGKPPFSFEQSATCALKYDHMNTVNWKNLTESLNRLEEYNGTGSRKRGIPSAYLYSGTSVERPGKFIRDNVWSPTAVSSQIGIVAIFKELGVKW